MNIAAFLYQTNSGVTHTHPPKAQLFGNYYNQVSVGTHEPKILALFHGKS